MIFESFLKWGEEVISRQSSVISRDVWENAKKKREAA